MEKKKASKKTQLTMFSKCFSGKYFTQGYYIWVLNFFPHVNQYHALRVNKTKT